MRLMDMRRALMAASGGGSPLIYSLYNRTVSDGEVIDTGIAPFKTGTATTILMDITIASNPTSSSSAYKYVLMRVYNSEQEKPVLCVRKPSQWSSSIRAIFGYATDNDAIGKIATSSAGRKRIVITHVADSKDITAIGKNSNDAETIKTVNCVGIGGGGIGVSPDTMTLGYSDTASGLPPATITKFEIYNTVLSQAEIDAFLA